MIIEVKKDPRYRVNTRRLKKSAQEILEEYGFLPKSRLEIVLVGKRKAKELNQRYRKMLYTPEVLTFPYQEKIPNGEVFLGEIVICFPLAREKATLENQRLEEAVDDLLRHGVKNLLKDG